LNLCTDNCIFLSKPNEDVKSKLTSNYFVVGKPEDQFRMATGEGQEGLQMSYLFPQRSIFLSLADAWSASSSTQVKHLNQRTNLRSTNC